MSQPDELPVAAEGFESSNGERPLVSVCIPAYRRPEALMETLDSLAAQTLQDFEVVITDETGELESLVRARSDERIRYHANEHRLGFAANHVRALSLAHGQYLAILHDDDRWHPDHLRQVVDVFAREPDIGVVFVGVIGVSASRTRVRVQPVRPGRQGDMLATLIETPFMLPSATVFTASSWERSDQNWPDLSCADMVFYLSAARNGEVFYHLDAELLWYGEHAGQLSAENFAFFDDQLTFWRAFQIPSAGPHAALLEVRRRQALIGHAGAALRFGHRDVALRDLRSFRPGSLRELARWGGIRAAASSALSARCVIGTVSSVRLLRSLVRRRMAG